MAGADVTTGAAADAEQVDAGTVDRLLAAMQTRAGLVRRECGYVRATATATMMDRLNEIAAALRDGRWPVLVGATGSGKTFAACATLNGWLVSAASDGEEITAHFVVWNDLLMRVRSTYMPSAGETEWAIISALQRARLVVLDDVGAEHRRDGSTWGPSILEAIIDGRYRRQRATILTTNLEPAALQAGMDPRTVSRLTAVAQVIQFGAEDMRVMERDGHLPKEAGRGEA